MASSSFSIRITNGLLGYVLLSLYVYHIQGATVDINSES